MSGSKIGGVDAANAVAVSALRAQQARMRVIAENMANSASTAQTKGGDPYQRQVPVFAPKDVEGATGVEMKRVELDPKPFPTEYNPSHPAADAQGYVKLPNVDTLVEGLDMKAAQRAYEAALNVLDNLDAMDQATMRLLKR